MKDNSPDRGPRRQVFVAGVEHKRSAVLGYGPKRGQAPQGRYEKLPEWVVHRERRAKDLLLFFVMSELPVNQPEC
jgi:hypothetical protein